MYAFPNHVKSIEFTTGWKNIKGDQWKQDAPELNFESHTVAKGLNTYVNMVFLVLIFNKCEKNSKNLFSLCHYGVLCVD